MNWESEMATFKVPTWKERTNRRIRKEAKRLGISESFLIPLSKASPKLLYLCWTRNHRQTEWENKKSLLPRLPQTIYFSSEDAALLIPDLEVFSPKKPLTGKD